MYSIIVDYVLSIVDYSFTLVVYDFTIEMSVILPSGLPIDSQ